MKKLFGILTALLPVIYAAGMGLLMLIDSNDTLLFASLGVYFLLSIVFCIGYGITRHGAECRSLARINLWILGSNVALFAAEIAWLVYSTIQVHIAAQQGAMEGSLGIFLLMIVYLPSWISYLMCRITAAMCCFDVLKEKSDSGSRMLHTVFHLFPVLDIISAIWVYGKVRCCQSFQQPTIETE